LRKNADIFPATFFIFPFSGNVLFLQGYKALSHILASDPDGQSYPGFCGMKKLGVFLLPS